MPFVATWMAPEIIILSEVSQKKRQIPYDITYMWNLKNSTNESIHKTETDSRKQTFGYRVGKGVGEGEIRSMGLTDTNYYR